MMDSAKFGEFHQQIKRNQDELTSYLKELDSWKEEISKKDSKLNAGSGEDSKSKGSHSGNYLPPVRNSLHRKRKVKRRNVGDALNKKPERIPGHDFRAWDKFDVDKALEEVENRQSSSYEESTDEEWEEERMKQQAIFEKDLGNDFFKKQKYDEAIECYTKGINCDPTNAALYANRAMALMKQEKYGAVEQDCTDAIALDPTYIKAYMRRGTARRKLDKKKEALGDFRQILKLDPDDKMAQRETAALEQDLRISAEGIVLPIKKSLKKRSKKPLVRIEIQEIDHDEVQTKLNEAVAKTTATQSAEKKRIIAQDNEMFNQFMTTKGGGDGGSGKSIISDQPKQNGSTKEISSQNSDIKAEQTPQNTAQSFLSPSDIGKSKQQVPQSQKNVVTKPIASPSDIGKLDLSSGTAGAKGSSPQQSPRTSPRAPVNSYQFQRDWKTVKGDLNQVYEYLKQIPPTDYSKMIGEFLEADVMNILLKVFRDKFLRDGINVTELLINLGKVKRFSMIVMFMSGKEKSVVKEITETLAKLEDTDQEKICTIRKLYEL